MTSSFDMKSGALVTLQELYPSSQYFKQGASLRITARLKHFCAESEIATIADGDAILKIDTQRLEELSFEVGSLYQFIGELLIKSDNEAILQARVGRNVDGMDLNLYNQSLMLLRQFQADEP